MAWQALAARFMTTWCSWVGSAITRGQPSGSRQSMVMLAGRVGRSRSSTSVTTAARETGTSSWSTWRLKVRICRTRARARREASTIARLCSATIGSSPFSADSSSARPRIGASRLLKSWAMPPARLPIASSLRVCSSCRSNSWCCCLSRSCSVRSMMVTNTLAQSCSWPAATTARRSTRSGRPSRVRLCVRVSLRPARWRPASSAA